MLLTAPLLALAASGGADKATIEDRVDARLRRVQLACGQLCNMSAANLIPGGAFGQVRQRIDCNALWNEEAIDAQRETSEAPASVPAAWLDEFSMGGRYPFSSFCSDHLRHQKKRHPSCRPSGVLDAKYLGGSALHSRWARATVDALVAQAQAGTLEGTYGRGEVARLRDGLSREGGIKGASVLVIGSENPWVEALCLSLGASNVTTLEYGAISTDHPQLHAYTPDVMRDAIRRKAIRHFDRIVTFSSVEHSGLGRCPWGRRSPFR